MDNGYFELFAYKFKCWLGSVTRHIQNQQIKDYHYINERWCKDDNRGNVKNFKKY
jgi:hypothetical protein